MGGRKIQDYTGKRFGKLTVISYVGRDKNNIALWKCQCDCGNIRELNSKQLRVKNGYNSCKECVKKDRLSLNSNIMSNYNTRLKKEKLYSVWVNMKQRCNNPKDRSYKYYGKRGIKVCPQWLHNYNAFKEWAFSNSYGEGLTIDRIDVNGDYCPENCRFTTQREQIYNSRRTCLIDYKGKKIPLAKMAYDLKLPYDSMYNYLRNYRDNNSTTNLL